MPHKLIDPFSIPLFASFSATERDSTVDEVNATPGKALSPKDLRVKLAA